MRAASGLASSSAKASLSSCASAAPAPQKSAATATEATSACFTSALGEPLAEFSAVMPHLFSGAWLTIACLSSDRLTPFHVRIVSVEVQLRIVGSALTSQDDDRALLGCRWHSTGY